MKFYRGSTQMLFSLDHPAWRPGGMCALNEIISATYAIPFEEYTAGETAEPLESKRGEMIPN